ncbi:hypothetical protein ACH5RR_017757 [Cinchona calisaya]|uniref:Receptor-like serine/threonine-protein kinase n=1 Tax=Cinchona calisaya TaxID=153742 RepID=A0ABD2ZKT3_9GENT
MEKYRDIGNLPILLVFFNILLISPVCCASNDTITPSQPLKLGQTLISAGQIFELGFFSPASDLDSSLIISTDGNLKLIDGKQNTVWSTNASVQSNSTIALLTDNGDFKLKDNGSGVTLWESFYDPSDTFLASMQLGFSSRTGQKWFLTSWKNENDPAPGKFVTGLSDEKPPQTSTWINGTKPYWRGGPWDGWKFIGIEDEEKGYANGMYVTPDNQMGTVYVTLNTFNKSYISVVTIKPSGVLEILHWEGQQIQWNVSWTAPEHPCDIYGTCGPFSACSKNSSPICECLKGFLPLSSEDWSKGNWTSGCIRRTELMCERNSSNLSLTESKKDGFWKFSHMKLPDHYMYLYDEDALGCTQWCLNNCSCLAYAYPDGIGCMVWVTDIIDIQQFSNSGEDLYLRLADSELVLNKYSVNNLKKTDVYNSEKEGPASAKESSELPVIDFPRIKIATNSFNEANKLGEGGFGTVYKGKLEDGQQIAVKRLSSHSGQGMEEFKNEVILISKLQHRNLVRLLGCCIQGEEKIVILEYMKNKSLDTFLFDRTKRLELDWAKRFNIIQGIARGLLYLHRDSSLRIIHRDLKASNILLDDDMNPKISDFGLARTFRVTQELANTRRVVGTFGYMSPEYAMGGLFSEKSDVYSFGILLLEIISSKKNTGFGYHEKYLNLLGYAWQLWNECKAPELLDRSLTDSCIPSEVVKCIQIGLLCVQDHAADRPTMSSVVLMLSSNFENEVELPQPRQPTFTFQSLLKSNHFQSGICSYNGSINEVSISMVEGR